MTAVVEEKVLESFMTPLDKIPDARWAIPVARLREILPTEEQDEIEAKAKTFTLADAIREGSSTSNQEYNWGSGEDACALSAAVISCKARGLH